MKDNFFDNPNEIDYLKPENEPVLEPAKTEPVEPLKETPVETLNDPSPQEDMTIEIREEPLMSKDDSHSITQALESHTPEAQPRSKVEYNQFTPEFQRSLSQVSKPKKKHRVWTKMVAGLMIFALVGGAFFGAGYATSTLITNNTPSASNSHGVTIQQIENVINTETSTASIPELVAASLSPAVVTVKLTYEARGNNFFYNTGESEGSGSGVIFDITNDQLQIVTNYHVIEGADTIEIKTITGDVYPAQVLGYNSVNDLAVLAISLSDIPNDIINQLAIASFADSSAISQGEIAIAIGSPLGETFSNSVTVGVVSSVERSLTIDGYTHTLIQTDAAINPGNSGGGLFNAEGQLIGINTAKWQEVSVEGLGFAIPINLAQPLIEEIVDNPTGGDFAQVVVEDRPFLGVSIADVTSEIAEATGVPFGVYIQGTFEGSGAEEADIQAGDIIVSIDGNKVLSTSDLTAIIFNKNIGDTIDITLIRNGEIIEKSAVLYNYADFAE